MFLCLKSELVLFDSLEITSQMALMFFVALSHGKLDLNVGFMVGPKSLVLMQISGPKSWRKIINHELWRNMFV